MGVGASQGREVLDFMESRSRRPAPLAEEALRRSTPLSGPVLKSPEQRAKRRNEPRQRRRAARERIAGVIQQG